MTRSHGVTTARAAESGFLYVEILVAMAILAFVLLSMVPMFVVAARQSAASGDLTVAGTVARDKAEELKAADFDTLAASEDVVQVEGILYRRSWTIQNDTPHPGMKTVTVTVVPQRHNEFGPKRTAEVSFLRVP